MTPEPSFSRVDPKLTEEFLLSLDGVVDASVWMEAEGLRAHVTLHAHVAWTERRLKAECLSALGAHQTPRKVLMLLAGLPPTHAAVRTYADFKRDASRGLAA
jgi:hypothetical protein